MVGIEAGLIFICMALICLPVSHSLTRRGMAGIWWHVLAALVASLIIAGALTATLGLGWPNPSMHVGALLAVTVFWLIRRPDKDAIVPLDTHV